MLVRCYVVHDGLSHSLEVSESDTWVMKKGFTCINATGDGYGDYEYTDVPEAVCDFGPTYNSTYEGGAIANVGYT